MGTFVRESLHNCLPSPYRGNEENCLTELTN